MGRRRESRQRRDQKNHLSEAKRKKRKKKNTNERTRMRDPSTKATEFVCPPRVAPPTGHELHVSEYVDGFERQNRRVSSYVKGVTVFRLARTPPTTVPAETSFFTTTITLFVCVCMCVCFGNRRRAVRGSSRVTPLLAQTTLRPRFPPLLRSRLFRSSLHRIFIVCVVFRR